MLDAAALDLIFRNARTHNSLSGEVTDAQLRALWDVMKFGPTTGNSQPARLFFLRSKEAKERLRPALSPGNLEKTLSAPVTAILAYDLQFYELLPIAERVLAWDDWEAIHKAFAAHRDPKLGDDTGDEFNRLFQRIVTLAPPPLGLGGG